MSDLESMMEAILDIVVDKAFVDDEVQIVSVNVTGPSDAWGPSIRIETEDKTGTFTYAWKRVSLWTMTPTPS